MRKGSMLAVALGLCGWAVTPVAAGDESGELYFGVLGGVLVEPDEAHVPELDTGFGGDLRLGRVYDSGWGYEYRAFYNTLERVDGTLEDGKRGGLGAAAQYRLPSFLGISPYLQAGIGYVYSNLKPEDEAPAAPMLEAALGIVSVPFLRFGEFGLRGRVEGRYSFEDFEEHTLDLYAYGGLELALIRRALPPPAPEPVRVVEVEPQPEARDTIVKVLTLRGVNFELNSDRLRAESRSVLDEAAATLAREYPDARVEVAGHTDSTGAVSYNKSLSLRRANAVRNYLIGKGISEERLTAVGYGPDEPVADNATAEGRSQNRRVELRVKERSGPSDRRSNLLNPSVRW